ncbi:unnamed protein product [Miscanthus lutarioriparius]|uniref:Uncharacterized protein n=1 Tax=Miscanthus lutarioriparius TaxID=422564 RepID=A0A811Q186_9POAL|nr:unnamed protein product [Miscanthus lutarioriparius]
MARPGAQPSTHGQHGQPDGRPVGGAQQRDQGVAPEESPRERARSYLEEERRGRPGEGAGRKKAATSEEKWRGRWPAARAHCCDRAWQGSGHVGARGRAGRMDAGVGEEDEDTAGPPERWGSSAGAARAEVERAQCRNRRWVRAALGEEEAEGARCGSMGIEMEELQELKQIVDSVVADLWKLKVQPAEPKPELDTKKCHIVLDCSVVSLIFLAL